MSSSPCTFDTSSADAPVTRQGALTAAISGESKRLSANSPGSRPDVPTTAARGEPPRSPADVSDANEGALTTGAPGTDTPESSMPPGIAPSDD